MVEKFVVVDSIFFLFWANYNRNFLLWLIVLVHRELKMAALLSATSVRNRTLMGKFAKLSAYKALS